jgi:uncharacterized peroxidase-related enzyme
MAGTLDVCGLNLHEHDNLDADMKRVVKGIVKKYGFMPHFIRVFSTDNQRLKAFLQLYAEVERTDAGLTHLEHEMIALVSAATNGCVYCTAHHGALLRGVTGDALFTEYLSRNYKLADLSPRHRAMLDFTVKVHRQAEAIEEEDRDRLRDVGFSDDGIWAIASLAAFYAYANRVAQAIGLRPAPQYLEMNRGDNGRKAATG